MNKKGFTQILLIGILAVVAATILIGIYIKFRNQQAPVVSRVVEVSGYQFSLPDGWVASSVVNSTIDQFPGGTYCDLSSKMPKKNGVPCQYVLIKKINDPKVVIVATDTNQVPLGGGGFIPTVEEKDYMVGPKGYGETFKFVYRGTYDPTKPVGENNLIVKLKDQKGEATLYWASGCLKGHLCFSLNNSENLVGSSLTQEFTGFINGLKLINTDQYGYVPYKSGDQVYNFNFSLVIPSGWKVKLRDEAVDGALGSFGFSYAPPGWSDNKTWGGYRVIVYPYYKDINQYINVTLKDYKDKYGGSISSTLTKVERQDGYEVVVKGRGKFPDFTEKIVLGSKYSYSVSWGVQQSDVTGYSVYNKMEKPYFVFK